jgi:spore germination protein YaaH
LAHDRVLLSVSTSTTSVIEGLDAQPAARAARLASALEQIVSADSLDGVNIDIEGTRAVDAGPFATFVKDLVAGLRAADPTGAVILDSYASSAAPGKGFFDLRRLAPLVDEVFLMAYDMDNAQVASASSPLKSPSLGYSVVQSLMQYEKFIPARKIVLGMPFYGNDFTTVSGAPGARATAVPEAFSYDAIVKAGKTPLWDLASDTPYARFKRAGSWHQIWFDDPVSLALKTALAADFHTAGVGAWAFGMQGSADGLLAALDGDNAPTKLPIRTSS